ncbi:MAG TPA: BRO family protein [Prolixibacteraceae bacterium]
MTKDIQKNRLSIFEQIRIVDEDGNEFWTARQLAKALDYTDFRNFLSVIAKAKEACTNSGQPVENHLVEFNEMVPIGSGAERIMPSYKLSRYACYLIMQNADPSKEIIALGQTYFAVQTRMQEIRQMEEYNRLDSEDENLRFQICTSSEVSLRSQFETLNDHFREVTKMIGLGSGFAFLRRNMNCD